MRLNQASDFALRVLMLLANENEPITVEEIALQLRLVKSHVMKIVAKLVKAGILESHRGRTGGISLGKQPSQIMVGDVVREIEADLAIVECMLDKECECVFSPGCRLKRVMADARSAFLEVLDTRSLQSIVAPR